jgi:hypothetical protein
MKSNIYKKGLTLAASALIAAGVASAQGLEDVLVETYYISNATDATDADGGNLPVGSVTYRVYIDMAPGYKLLTMYGEPNHELRFETSTLFFNNEDRGAISPNSIPTNNIGDNTVMVDSWLGIGAGSSTLWAVPKSEDTNGAILNNDGFLQNTDALAGFPLALRDGLIDGPGTPPAVTFVPNTADFTALNDVNDGPVVSIFNAAWASLGGTFGPTATNRVCIAQITTDGDFSFKLNVQLLGPNGEDERYVASNPTGSEIEFAGLNFTSTTCNVNGGTVSTTSVLSPICSGDSNSNIVQVTVSGNTGVGRFGLVSLPSQNILATNASGSFNMNNFPAGNYAIGYVSVESLTQLAGVNNVTQLTGCFSLANFINVNTNPVSGGTLTANGPTTICTGSLSFSATGQVGTTFRFALVNLQGTQVFQSNATGTFDFTNLANGTYRVVHVAARGVNLNNVVPPTLPECVAASNQILVTKSCPSTLVSSPNPTAGTSLVSFSVAEEQMATLEVYDMSGRKIAELFRQDVQPNAEYKVEFDGASLPNGVYVYRLTTATEVAIEKFMIAK